MGLCFRHAYMSLSERRALGFAVQIDPENIFSVAVPDVHSNFTWAATVFRGTYCIKTVPQSRPLFLAVDETSHTVLYMGNESTTSRSDCHDFLCSYDVLSHLLFSNQKSNDGYKRWGLG